MNWNVKEADPPLEGSRAPSPVCLRNILSIPLWKMILGLCSSYIWVQLRSFLLPKTWYLYQISVGESWTVFMRYFFGWFWFTGLQWTCCQTNIWTERTVGFIITRILRKQNSKGYRELFAFVWNFQVSNVWGFFCLSRSLIKICSLPRKKDTHLWADTQTQAHLQSLPLCSAWTCKLFVMAVIFIHVSNPTGLFRQWRITHTSKTFAESGPGSNNSILITDNPRAMCTKEVFFFLDNNKGY